ncbi:MAG: endonuclease domain-containing protein [Clostridia bacterium]|nr:endonuclease domain-containing protein [Clostridia bacterium]
MPNTTYNKALKPYAQKLRREMTPEEKRLWYQFFKPMGIKAKRQQIIRDYIVDFYIPSAKLVIELDGSQHNEEEARQKDAERDDALGRLGLYVIRYSNIDINTRFRDVCEDILMHIVQCQKYPAEKIASASLFDE